MLQPYRVLDLTDEKGFLCGKILADLGAEVIKVEKPNGDKSRNIGPFFLDVPHQEKSLYWFSYNLNKKSITLDINTVDGKEIFKRLVKISDFIIESSHVGYFDSIGLGYSDLCIINPALIMTSITPYGQKGPYTNYKASDLTLLAMGGLLFITGCTDRPPVRISFPQSWLLAGSSAAAATMIAHYHRQITGEGQHVDVSMQASIVWAITNTIPLWELNQINLKRQGSFLSGRFGVSANQRIIWRCKDGFVAYVIFGGRLGVSMGNYHIMKWADEEGIADDFLREFNWQQYDLATATQETQSRLESYVERLFLKYTKSDLYHEGLKRDIKIFPVNTPKDILNDPQLNSRNFWLKVEHPELNQTIRYPGAFLKTPEYDFHVQNKPPLIGEHNDQIYKLLGISKQELIQLKQAGII